MVCREYLYVSLDRLRLSDRQPCPGSFLSRIIVHRRIDSSLQFWLCVVLDARIRHLLHSGILSPPISRSSCSFGGHNVSSTDPYSQKLKGDDTLILLNQDRDTAIEKLYPVPGSREGVLRANQPSLYPLLISSCA